MKLPLRRGRVRRPRPTTGILTLGLLVGLGSLFAMAWNTHLIHEYEADLARLTAQRAFEQDELRRCQVTWHRETRRDRIVPRAQTELGLHEVEPSAREVVMLRSTEGGEGGPAWLRHIARGLDRYGEVDGAFAGEEE